MEEMGEPAWAEEKDREGRGGCGDEGASEAACDGLHGAYDPSGGCCSERIGEEKAAVGAEQMSDAAGCVRSEDGKTEGAFDEIKDHRGEACDGAERHADEEDGKVLKRERDRREGKREGDVSAGGYKCGRGKDEDRFAGEGFLKRSGAGEAELGGDGGLHRAGSFRARGAGVR